MFSVFSDEEELEGWEVGIEMEGRRRKTLNEKLNVFAYD